ncbi:MAG: UbiX family flavin prenyltransferase [Candidatus Desulfofervidaceae bacterium]|nr:UbiX family flavin prenyltransferase [Candidatus Desulfofervidaceae bacterium]
MDDKQTYILAITGASGAIYAKSLIEYFYQHNLPLTCLISDVGKKVWEWEIGVPIEKALPASITLHCEDDWWAPVASGSVKAKAMIVMPCSMGTLAAIAQGLARNLIQRTADVMLKEKRPLILVPRETPLNIIHLENMLRLAKAGATISPAMPGFYHKPETVQDLVNFVVARVLDHLGLEHKLIKSWEEVVRKDV